MFKMSKMTSFLAVAGLVLALAPTTWAQVIIPLDGTAATAKHSLSGRVPANVTNGNGMVSGEGATGLHTGLAPGTGVGVNAGWLSDFNFPMWFRVDLGAEYDVGTMYVWNGEGGAGFTNTTGDDNARGVSVADIYYSSVLNADASDFGNGDWTLHTADQAFTQRADNTLDYLPTDIFALDVTARYIGLNIKDNHTIGGNNVASLNELQFFTQAAVAPVPEPASIAIWSFLGLCLAGYGYLRHRRNR